jgi:dienelactone hydrolase
MKTIVILLALALASQTNVYALPESDAAQGAPQAIRARTEIQKYDTAKKKQIKLTLRDGNQLKGYVSRSDDVSFDLTEKNGHVSKLSYVDVERVRGAGLSTGAKIAIVVGCTVAVVAIVFTVGLKQAGY